MGEPDDELERLAHAVIGAAIEVHRHLGPGLLEEVYEKALCREFSLRSIPYERQVEVRVSYKDETVGKGYIDMLVGGRLVIELKAVEALAPIHKVQTLSYLRIMRQKLGLLINFNVLVLRDGIKRVIL